MARRHKRERKSEFAKTYSEYYAIECLRKFFPEFESVCKSESPDFISQDGLIGIEVIRAEDEENNYILSKIIDFYSIGTNEKRQKKIIKKIAVSANKGFYNPCKNPQKAYLKKQQKLNEPQFRVFTANWLIIVAERDHFLEENINEFSSFLATQYGKKGKDFDIVFIISYENVFRFDNHEKKCYTLPLEREEHYAAKKSAAKAAKGTGSL